MAIFRLGELTPSVSADAFVHESAVLIGDVTLESGASVWPNAVLRADYGPIRVGPQSVVEDGCVLHGTEDETVVGRMSVLGHIVHAQGCVIGDEVLIGSGSVVLDRAHIGSGSLVAAGATVTPGTVAPENSRIVGTPGVVHPGRGVSPTVLRHGVEQYGALARRYRSDLVRIG